jgi:chromosome segregation ATPase
MKLSHTIGISSSVGAVCLLIGLMNTSGTSAKAASIIGVVGSGGITLIAANHIMQKRKIKLEAELSKSRSQLATAKREVEISQRALHDMENLKRLLAQLREAIAQKDAAIAAQSQKISAVQGELGRAIVVIADLAQAKDQALANLSEAEKEKTVLSAEIQQLEHDYETELKAYIDKAIEAMRDSLDFEVRIKALAEKEKIIAVYDKLDGLFKALADQNSMLSSAYREDVGSMAGTVADLTGEIGNFAAHKRLCLATEQKTTLRLKALCRNSSSLHF